MSTTTFSSRVDRAALAFADSLSQKEYGLFFGQYCGTILLNYIKSTGRMPILEFPAEDKKKRAALFIKQFALIPHNKEFGLMSDIQIDDLIASRYA